MKINFNYIANIILGWVLITYVLEIILFSFNLSLSRDICLLYSLIYVISSYLIYSFINKVLAFNLIAASFFVTIFFVFFRGVHDFSYDGQMYHSEAIIRISEGWNPVYEHFVEKEVLDYVFNHFAKSHWIFSGYLYNLTQSINSLLAINLMFAFILFVNTFRFLEILMLSRKIRFLFSTLVTFTPVFLNTYLSLMLDYQIYVFLTLIFLKFIEYEKTNKKLHIMFVYGLMFYFLNLKFTALVYAFFLIVFVFLYKLYKYKVIAKNMVLHFVVSASLGIMFFGYNTYVKNYILHQHIFFPIYGIQDYPILVESGFPQAIDYKNGNRLINIIKSVFVETTFSDAYSNRLDYKFPFEVSKYEVERFAFAGVLVGGFGVWYSAIFILSIVTFLHFIFFDKSRLLISKYKIEISFVVMFIFITTYMNPLWYIARYVPQFYIFPIISLLIIFFLEEKKLFICGVAMVLVNLFFIMGYTYYNVIVSNVRNKQISNLKHKGVIKVDFKDHRGIRAVFNDNNIEYKEVDSFSKCDRVDTFFRSNVIYSSFPKNVMITADSHGLKSKI